jgi:phosphoadenosine phosphosulfate reductase
MATEGKRTPDMDGLEGKKAEEVLSWALNAFEPSSLALATSFGLEDQVLTHMAVLRKAPVRIFTLDTGRLFPEVYGVMQRMVDEHKVSYEVFAPDPLELAELVREKGPNLFYLSVENRKACCGVRKVHPLKKALAGMAAWICGLRREQSQGRSSVKPVEWDGPNGLWKISPLYDWTEEQVRAYLKEKNVPYCALQDAGFRSLGCAPCTRAVAPHQDPRAGRWWWEDSEKKECGLHLG